VHLDPRGADVRVPAWLRKQPQLVLQIGLDMPIPIPDLRVDAEGIYGTLSFQRTPFTCVVPWSAVFALLDEAGKGMLWPESLPPEIAAEVAFELERATRPRTGRSDTDGRPPAASGRRAGPARDTATAPPTTGGDAAGEGAPAVPGGGASARAGRARPQRAPARSATPGAGSRDVDARVAGAAPGVARELRGSTNSVPMEAASPNATQTSGAPPRPSSQRPKLRALDGEGTSTGRRGARKGAGERPAWLRVVK
jgi:hypothetical protein